MSDGETVYQSDPNARPDADFEPGGLQHLVSGNRGRLLDPRRTPVEITGVDCDRGSFEVRVEAFEDAGARWLLPFEHVARFQFERSSTLASPSELDALVEISTRLQRALEIPASREARAHTLRELGRERSKVAVELAGWADGAELDLGRAITAREGFPLAFAALSQLLAERGLAGLERDLLAAWVSNPASGEAVKGHAIVLAEMGLCPYSGTIVRDCTVLEGDGSRERRRAHILTRLAFLGELTSALGVEQVELFRGMSAEGPLAARASSSLISATFSREVAAAHFAGGEATRSAALLRQVVPVGRLLVTFLETPAMNARYREAEAMLIGDPANELF